MNKWKLSKKRKSISTKMIIFILLILTSIISVSYAKYSTTLKINSKVVLKGRTPVVTDEIPVVLLPNTEGGNDYIDFAVSGNVLNVQNQYVSGNSFIVDFKSTTQTGKPRELSLNLDFKNATEYVYTDGSMTYEATGNVAFISEQPEYSITQNLAPNENRKYSNKFWVIKV